MLTVQAKYYIKTQSGTLTILGRTKNIIWTTFKLHNFSENHLAPNMDC